MTTTKEIIILFGQNINSKIRMDQSKKKSYENRVYESVEERSLS